MNSLRSVLHTRKENRGPEKAARTAVETRKVQSVHGSHCICHRCRRG